MAQPPTTNPNRLPSAASDSLASLEDFDQRECGCPSGFEDRHLEGCVFVRPITQQLREVIAQQHFMGFGTAEIASLHQLEPTRVRSILASDKVKRIIAERKAATMAAASRSFTRFLMVADQLAEAQVRDALDPNSPNNYKARVYILDKVMPQRSAIAGDTNVNIQMNAAVVTQLSEAVEAARVAREAGANGSPVLVAGKKALPPIDIEADSE